MSKTNDAPTTGHSDPGPRRALAVGIDLIAVALPTAAVALLTAERFAITGDLNGRPQFSEVDQLRINEIAATFNRAARFGDTVLTLSGPGWWATLGVLIALTVLVFVIVPGKLRRRTPGRLLLGLAAPSAADNDGDDDDGIELVDSADAIETATTHPAAVETGTTTQASPETTGTLDGEFGTEFGNETDGEGDSESDGDSGSESGADTDRGDAENDDPSLVPAALRGTASTTDDELAEFEYHYDSDEPVDTVAILSGAVAPRSVSRRPVEHDDSLVGASAVAAPVALADANEYVEWDRELLSTPAGNHGSVDGNGGSFQALALTESSLAENPLNQSTSAAPATSTATSTSASADAPTWSEKWNAWLYQDPATELWYRHDPELNKWCPLS